MQPITIGTKATVSVIVTEAQLAVNVGSGSLPVFATPMLAALMEKAACLAVADFFGCWRNDSGNGIGSGTYRSDTGGHDRYGDRRGDSRFRSGNHLFRDRSR